jgi:hypothetical protein
MYHSSSIVLTVLTVLTGLKANPFFEKSWEGLSD